MEKLFKFDFPINTDFLVSSDEKFHNSLAKLWFFIEFYVEYWVDYTSMFYKIAERKFPGSTGTFRKK
jgi:hypothetical protein